MFAVAAASAPVAAKAQGNRESLGEFSGAILSDYGNFRSDVLNRYTLFLDSVWNEYPYFEGEKRYEVPKPKTLPAIGGGKSTAPSASSTLSAQSDSKVLNVPGISPINRDSIADRKIIVDFYGIPIDMVDIDYNIPDKLGRKSVSRLWDYMYGGGYHNAVLKEIRRVVGELNLNDWLTYVLVDGYVDKKFERHTPFTRNALKHFLLANMGYDIRLAETGSGNSLLLLPFNQFVYARPYIVIDGNRYYVMDGTKLAQEESVYTCAIPHDVDPGNSFELRINELRLPYRPYQFRITDGDIEIEGEINANIIPVLCHYPEMPVGDYAESVVSGDVRSNIVRRLKEALDGKGKKETAEALLHFTQSAFEYAADGDFHGYEKPYFFEEMLYYPKNDCEDRALFLSYLLSNVAGIENHIIQYPGHEATAFALPDEQLKGVCYTYKGKKFYIADPSCIGATTGTCMPCFERTTPKIDYIYK